MSDRFEDYEDPTLHHYINVSGFFDNYEVGFSCDQCFRRMVPFETEDNSKYIGDDQDEQKPRRKYICQSCGQVSNWEVD